MTLPASAYRQQEAQRWQNTYHQHLQQRLHVTREYIVRSSNAQLRAHLRSLLTTLDESRRYDDLKALMVEVIAALHPLPMRWEFGSLWQPHLAFALDHLPKDDETRRAVYYNALAEISFFSGDFEQAVQHAQKVLSLKNSASSQTAYAGRMIFLCLRSMGEPDRAEEILEEALQLIHAAQETHQNSRDMALGWLVLNQCQLELLREDGKTEQALDLVDELLQLDAQQNDQDAKLTADLTTRRSTLLWMRGAFQDAVNDLMHAIALYRSVEDIFNAESLQSNLGLVYWSMGELTRAEASLKSAIQFYQKTGAEQLITHDLGNLGLVHFARGHLQAALDQTRKHITHAEKLGFTSEYNRGRRNLGTILYYFGDYEQALAEINYKDEFHAERGNREGYYVDFLWSACCYYQMGEREKALTKVEEAVSWSVENQSPVLEAVSRRCLAFFLPADDPARLHHLERCLALSRTQERQLEKAAVLLTMAQSLPADEREQCWQNGADLLTRIDAEAWLEGRSIEDPPYIPTLV